MTERQHQRSTPTAFLVRNLEGGGVQRSQMRLAEALAARGYPVDLVACSAPGPQDASVPLGVRLIVLPRLHKHLARFLPLLAHPAALHVLAPAMLTKVRHSPTIVNLLGLARYLRREQPVSLVAGPTDLNLEAVWAQRLARTSTRLILSEHVHFSTGTIQETVANQPQVRILQGGHRRT